MKTNKRGFTLIELLVVVAIIGILASVVMVSLGSARSKARDARRISDMQNLKTGLELYFASYNRYPASFEMGSSGAGGVKFMVPEFMPSMPVDPLTGASYSYTGLKLSATSADTCLKYHLGATLENADANVPVMQTKANRAADGNVCKVGTTASGADFNGQDTTVYDIAP